jgi:hypothetical protein
MIKGQFGDAVRSKSDIGQINEVLCKVLCHNLCVLIQAMHALGMQPRCLRATANDIPRVSPQILENCAEGGMMRDLTSLLADLMLVVPLVLLALTAYLLSLALPHRTPDAGRQSWGSFVGAVMVGMVGGIGGLQVGLVVSCWWWYPGSNLCGLPAFLYAAPLGASLSVAAYLGVWRWASRIGARRNRSPEQF